MEIAAELNRDSQAAAATATRRVVGRPFPKGVSGNPAGRPRKAVTGAAARKIVRGSIHEMVRAAAFATVEVEIDGELAEVTALEAGMRQVAMQAAAGDRLALLALTRLLAAAERDPAASSTNSAQAEAFAEAGNRPAHAEIEAAETYKRAWGIVLESAKTWNTEAPVPAPHPDTIVIDRDHGVVRNADGSPAAVPSLDPLIAYYRKEYEALRIRLEELRLPRAQRPEATRRWVRVDGLVERLRKVLPEAHRLPPLLPPEEPFKDFADALEANYRRTVFFSDGFPEAETAPDAPVPETEAEPELAPSPGPKPEPEPAQASEPAEPPAPVDEEAIACRDICARAVTAAGGTSHWVNPPGAEEAATEAGLRRWLAALNDAWDRIEYIWGSSRLEAHRMKLERQQKQVERARAVVEQGLAAWEARQAARGPGAGGDGAGAAAVADDPPDEDGPDADEARAYVRICTEALELAKGACLDVRSPKPSPHLVMVTADGGVGWHGADGPDEAPTMANLRRWPARLEALAAELEAAIGRTVCPGELVRLRSGRRLVERMREIVEDGVATWDSGAG